ncbi:MAG: BatA domain-containing protein [Nitrospirota bacterium]
MQFENYNLLWLSLAAPLLFYFKTRSKRTPVPYPGFSSMKGLPRVKLSFLPALLISAACVLLVVAAARPRVGRRTCPRPLR